MASAKDLNFKNVSGRTGAISIKLLAVACIGKFRAFSKQLESKLPCRPAATYAISDPSV